MTKTQETNLGTDISQAKKGISTFFKYIFGGSDFNRLAYFNNPHSMLDEILYLLWIILAGATAFTIYYGIKYHSSIFTNNHTSASETQAITYGILVIGELIMIFFGHLFVRCVFSNLWYKGLPEAIFVICLGAVTFFTFQWSIGISTNGYSLTTANAEKKSELAKTGDYSKATTLFDNQIADQQKTIEEGRKITWHGKLTWEGQQVIKRANQTIQQLNTQRQSAVNDTKARDEASLKLSDVNIGEAATRTSDYGGKAEILKIVCLFMLGLLEQISFRQNKKLIDKKDEEDQKDSTNSKFYKLADRKEAVSSSSPIRVMAGFKIPTVTNDIPTVTPVITVTTAINDVTATKEPDVVTVVTEKNNPEFAHGDKLIRALKQGMSAEVNNLKIGNGKSESIISRLRRKHEQFIEVVETVKVSPELREEICAWAETTVKILL